MSPDSTGLPHVKGTRARTVNKLTATQMFQVMTAVKERYTDSGLSQTAFAEVLTKEVGHQVSVSSVQTACESFGIVSNKEHAKRQSQVTVIGRIALLETEVRHLKAEMEELIRFRRTLEEPPVGIKG